MKILYIFFFTMAFNFFSLISSAQNSSKIIAGTFSVTLVSERFDSMSKRIPELICAGIFNKSGFTYWQLESLGLNFQYSKKRNSKLDEGFIPVKDNTYKSLWDSLNYKKIRYFISGNYAELGQHFKISFNLADVRTGNLIRSYDSDYKPLDEIYKQIDSAAGFLKQAISLNDAGVSSNDLKNVAIIYFNNELDEETASLFDVQPDFMTSFAAVNLKGRNKFNVLSGKKINTTASMSVPLNDLFDLLRADAIVTGVITKDNKKSRRILLKPIIYTRTSVIDTLYLPEQKRSSIYKNDLFNAVTRDIQSFLDDAIEDGGSWDSSLMNMSLSNIATLLQLSNKSIVEGNLSQATVLSYKMTQRKDSAWIGFNQLGKIELKRNNNDEAITYFDEAITNNKKNAEGYEGKGNAMLNKGQYKDAIEQFDLCSTLDPQYPGIHLQIARCYFQLKNDYIFFETKLALESGRDSAKIYNLLGRYYLEIKNKDEIKNELFYDSAAAYFQKASVIEPQYKSALSGCFLQKGYFLSGRKDFIKAVDCYQRSFIIDSTVFALDGARYACTFLDQYGSVDSVIAQGLKLQLYDSASVYEDQARICITRIDSFPGDEVKKLAMQKANHYLDLWLIVSKKDAPTIYRTKARAYFHAGRYDSSIIYYQKVLDGNPVDWVNYLNLAEASIMSNNVLAASNLLTNNFPKFKNKMPASQLAVTQFLQITAKMYLGKSYDTELVAQKELMKKQNVNDKKLIFDWSFATFQKWLDSGVVDSVLRDKVNDQLKLIGQYFNFDIEVQ